MTTPLAEAIEALGLSVRAEFVPFSKSRNAAEERRTLNWRVTLVFNNENYGPARQGDILTTDYSAGIAHCPSYKQNTRNSAPFGRRATYGQAIEFETERGKKAMPGYAAPIRPGYDIEPDATDVIYSLVMDASVLDAGGFEDWATEYGYDTDSRAALATYQACLEIALQLRAGIGQTALEALQTAAQDY